MVTMLLIGCVSWRPYDVIQLAKNGDSAQARRLLPRVPPDRFAAYILKLFKTEDFQQLKVAVDMLSRSPAYCEKVCASLSGLCPASYHEAAMFTQFLTAIPHLFRYPYFVRYLERVPLDIRFYAIRQWCRREVTGMFVGLPPVETRELDPKAVARQVAPYIVSERPELRMFAAMVLFLSSPQKARFLIPYIEPLKDIFVPAPHRAECSALFLNTAESLTSVAPQKISRKQVLRFIADHPYAVSACNSLFLGSCIQYKQGDRRLAPLAAARQWLPPWLPDLSDLLLQNKTIPELKGTDVEPDKLQQWLSRQNINWSVEEIRLLSRFLRFWRAFYAALHEEFPRRR